MPPNLQFEMSRSKLKCPVSSVKKTAVGADRYAKIRSVVDTTIKNGQDVYTAFLNPVNC